PGTDGFNLIGNPYPSVIDLEAVTFSGSLGSTVYTLNSNNTNGFGTYQRSGSTSTNGTALNGGSRYLLPGEGFFVKASGTGATVTFHESSKTTYPTGGSGTVTGPATVFSLKIPTPTIRIKLVQDTNYYNEAIVSFSTLN